MQKNNLKHRFYKGKEKVKWGYFKKQAAENSLGDLQFMIGACFSKGTFFLSYIGVFLSPITESCGAIPKKPMKINKKNPINKETF